MSHINNSVLRKSLLLYLIEANDILARPAYQAPGVLSARQDPVRQGPVWRGLRLCREEHVREKQARNNCVETCVCVCVCVCVCECELRQVANSLVPLNEAEHRPR